MYQALYRKYRPKTLEDVCGQETIVKILKNSIRKNEINHAYLFAGPRGTGKTSIAKIFAKIVNCENLKDCVPCEKCTSCTQTNNSDIIEIDAASNNGVDEIRELRNKVNLVPSYGKYKVYIIEEAEKMTPQAQNALLKTIEEPPEYVVFIMLCNSMEQILPTILSRCIVLKMKPVRDDEMRKYLMQVLKIPDYRAEICIAFARGNVGRAKALAQSEDFDKIRKEALSLLKNIYDMELTDVIDALKRIKEFGFNIGDYLDIMSVWYRDVLLFKATHDMNHLIFRDEIQYIRKVASRTDYEGIEKVTEALENAKKRIESNVSFELAMELLMLTIREN